MNAYLGGDTTTVVPAALGSLACLGLDAGPLWYLFRLESSSQPAGTAWPVSPKPSSISSPATSRW